MWTKTQSLVLLWFVSDPRLGADLPPRILLTRHMERHGQRGRLLCHDILLLPVSDLLYFLAFWYTLFQWLLFFQGHTHRPKAESRQTPSCSQAAQNGEPRTRVKGCVRLCCDLSEKCVQHSHCLHAIPPHLCHGGRATLQRQVLLLQRWIQAQRRRVSVSWYSMWFLRNYTA